MSVHSVIGGNGTIGAVAVRHLAAAGCEVRIVQRHPRLIEGAVATASADVFDLDGLTKAVEGSDVIYLILGAVMEHYQSGEPVMEGAAQTGHQRHDGPDGDIVRQIMELLDTRVRPAVAQDGGDITFHGFDRGVVYLHMKGACAGCPSSTLTLKMGIENLLRHYIPEVTEVRPVAA